MRIHAFIVMLCATLSLSAQNVTGRITCKGKGVPNVVVSDGYELTKTNQAGYYELRSLKQNGYDVRVLDLVEHFRSHGYNPFHYFRSDDDILLFV